MHVGCSEEIIIGDVHVLAAGPWLWTDKEPRLVHIVHAIEMVGRLGNAGGALEIIEGEGRWVTVEGAIDIGRTERKERARQILEAGEIDRLIARAARHAPYPWRRVDRELFGPGVAPVA
jgi:hypothetical protein